MTWGRKAAGFLVNHPFLHANFLRGLDFFLANSTFQNDDRLQRRSDSGFEGVRMMRVVGYAMTSYH